jgi:hypothetical protein
MFNRNVVQEALIRSWAPGDKPDMSPMSCMNIHDSINSRLIHDIFGGEILKTRKKNGWHFYNRIDGERIDFLCPETDNNMNVSYMEDIPSTPEETCAWFDEEDYSEFFMRFITAFEETVGLDKSRFDFSY